MKLLRSFEEFTFEAVSWALFYPLTVWRILTRPLTMMAYSDAEQAKDPDVRYDEALSPVMLLLITIFAVNMVEGALHVDPFDDSKLLQSWFASPQILALCRAIVFSLIPLVAAGTLLRRTGVRLSREAIRPPFYAQCFLATPCCLAAGMGFTLLRRPDLPSPLGVALIVLASVWFLVTQTRWFRASLGVSWLNAVGTTLWALARAFLYLLALVLPLALVSAS
jgi:hypothetical protein